MLLSVICQNLSCSKQNQDCLYDMDMHIHDKIKKSHFNELPNTARGY